MVLCSRESERFINSGRHSLARRGCVATNRIRWAPANAALDAADPAPPDGQRLRLRSERDAHIHQLERRIQQLQDTIINSPDK